MISISLNSKSLLPKQIYGNFERQSENPKSDNTIRNSYQKIVFKLSELHITKPDWHCAVFCQHIGVV